MKQALFALSGDPIHNGHIDIVNRAATVFDRVIIGIGMNPDKGYLFTPDERKEMARRSLERTPNVEVVGFEGLLVDYAYEQGIRVIVKGVRNSNDFDYENILHLVGESQELGIDTYVLFSRPDLMHVSSTMIRALQKEEGFIHRYVPLYVKQCLEARISGQYIVGVTGEIGTGKSQLSGVFRALGEHRKVEVHPIEMDEIGTQILEELTEPSYIRVREEVVASFGVKVRNRDGSINRKAIGNIVYRDAERLNELNRILDRPLMVRLRRELRGKRGLILLNSGLLVESSLTHLCNNNVVLVSCDKRSQETRLRGRGLDTRQIERRLASQYSEVEKREKIQARIRETNQGMLWEVDASDGVPEREIARGFEALLACFGLGEA